MKTRAERDRELQTWMHSDTTKLTTAWKAAHKKDAVPAEIVRYSELITQILEREYPQDRKAA